jgi:hypothetical protein
MALGCAETNPGCQSPARGAAASGRATGKQSWVKNEAPRVIGMVFGLGVGSLWLLRLVDDDFIAMVRVLGFYHPMRGETVLLKTR